MASRLRARLFLFLCCLRQTSVAEDSEKLVETFIGHHVVSVKIDTRQQLKTLLELKDSLELDFWNHAMKEGHTGMIRVPPGSVDGILKAMESEGMQYNINSEDLQSLIEAEKRLIVPDEPDLITDSTAYELFDFTKYHAYKAVTRTLWAYAKAHTFVEAHVIGQTHDDNDIVAVKIARKPNLPIIIVDCGIHAREWVTISTCMYIINELIKHHETESTTSAYMQSFEWRVIPCLNPDGYEFSRSSNRMWRKNRSVQFSSNGTKCYGTDLNRNFDVSFCSTEDEADPCKEMFCGKAPFSEPESHAFREFVTGLQDRILYYFSMHAFGDLWLIPYSFRLEKAPDYDTLMTKAHRAVKAIHEVSGVTYKAGPVAQLLYIAPGTSIDWMYVKRGIRMSFTVEVSGEKAGFFLNQTDIAKTSNEAWSGVLAVIQ